MFVLNCCTLIFKTLCLNCHANSNIMSCTSAVSIFMSPSHFTVKFHKLHIHRLIAPMLQIIYSDIIFVIVTMFSEILSV